MAEKDSALFPSVETEQIQPDTTYHEEREVESAPEAGQDSRPVRSLKPTVKVLENYHYMKDEFNDNLHDLWERVTSLMSSIQRHKNDAASLQDTIKRLDVTHGRYKRLSTRYAAFLKDSNIDEALSELSKADSTNRERDAAVQDAKDKAELHITYLQEARSNRSGSSKHSSRSYRSSCSRTSALSDRILEARLNAERSKLRRSYAEKKAEAEAEAKKAEAETEAKKAMAEAEAEAKAKILQTEMEEKIALAEVTILEQALKQNLDPICLPPLEEDDPAVRTRVYVQRQISAAHAFSSDILPDNVETSKSAQPTVPVLPTASAETQDQCHNVSPQEQQSSQNDHKTHSSPSPQFKPQSSKSPEVKPQLNPAATSFYPGAIHPFTPHSLYAQGAPQANTATRSEGSDMSEFARFMVSRELISTSLSKFDDCAENYRAWKATFKAAIADLNLSAEQELDLMVKWLGPDSSNRIKSLRTVYVGQAESGLAAAWLRLERTYGSAEAIERSLFKRLQNVPRINLKEAQKLLDLSDLLMELELAKKDPRLSGLCYLDTAHGVNPIVSKLPHSLQEKWAVCVSRYKRSHDVTFPPFIQFCKFIDEQAQMRNDPSLDFLESNTAATATSSPRYESVTHKRKDLKSSVSVRKTNLPLPAVPTDKQHTVSSRDKSFNRECPIHKKPHSLNKCRGFRSKTMLERKKILSELGVCFKCCASLEHMAKDCKSAIKCEECHSDKHPSALHPTSATSDPAVAVSSSPATNHGGEPQANTKSTTAVSCSCSEVCGESQSDKCCARICLIRVYPEGQPENVVKMYAIIDDQSNRSLAGPKFFEAFGIKGPAMPYTLNTCSGRIETSGRRAQVFIASPINGGVEIPLPTLIECDQIPNQRDEIPTPEAAFHQPHLRHLVNVIPPMDTDAEILLLLGRDNLRIHKVRQQCNGPDYAPYAQRLDLGWVIIGNVCLDRTCVDSFKTYVRRDGRTTFCKPCPRHYDVKEKPPDPVQLPDAIPSPYADDLGKSVFHTTKDDNKVAPSMEDKEFVRIMDNEFLKDKTNHWVFPLPFRATRVRLPNNREQALSRFNSLQRTLSNKPEMKEHIITFMSKIFRNNHAEPAPLLKENEECWYLPSFGVYHPRKPKQIRVVFDSSAKHQGVSLNDVLLTGPNLTNNLVGVLMRFRKEPIAITADIEQMFHCFIVREDHRNFLRFLWYKDNDPNKEMVEYRMRVHVFGNSPSPAVATYGLRRTAQEGESEYGIDARDFVEKDFYVDDGLKSLPTEEAAIDLLKRTQGMLYRANLRLHKIASNSPAVMRAFESSDYAPVFKDIDLGSDCPPVQRSLGLRWNLSADTFSFQINCADKPFTKRGVLSVVNSLYDPLGFVAPITIQGKSLLRQLSETVKDWDAPLPPDKESKWETWKQSLCALDEIHIPRCYARTSLAASTRKELHVFSDASMEAIAAVAYLKVTGPDNQDHVGFVFGKAKLAPKPEHTIPRLELCGTVLAVELADFIQHELDVNIDNVQYYSDSKIVLGYIYNQTRRFYVYVSNRIERIRRSSKPEQWYYIPSELNPADHATRRMSISSFANSSWLSGPKFLLEQKGSECVQEVFSIQDPDGDPEVRSEVSALTTNTKTTSSLGCQRFERFSNWMKLVKSIARLVHIARSYNNSHEDKDCHGWHVCHKPLSAEDISHCESLIICCVQQSVFSTEWKCLYHKQQIPLKSPIAHLNPVMDSFGLLRVGGRLNQAKIVASEQHPCIIPSKHHITDLLIRHFHEKTEHQGRQITEGKLRSAGLWIIGMKRRVAGALHRCVQCRKTRGKQVHQQMADLPSDRLSAEPPFTYIGLDVFGPWMISARKTRGGYANSKRWAVLFTCMSVRAVHIEVIESMDTSSLINALRHFLAIRGPVKQLRSDRGSNFIGACRDLDINIKPIQDQLAERGCTWIFNPPHSSHMGGSWERMIGISRNILNSMLMDVNSSRLTHETLVTLLAEVSAIINSRPLVPVSMDPEMSTILTPTTLLTQKTGNPLTISEEFTHANTYQKQWKRVQYLADYFWNRWRKEYLVILQGRRKWRQNKPNLKEGDVVLMKEPQAQRIDWPMGIVTKTFPSQDGKVRKNDWNLTQHPKLYAYGRELFKAHP
ncbi:uncharacterized protein RB166_011994 [Leptodactylus fuscus]|uniref:uncharacterized protein LOC142198553 n=1 Tax=Leptodactylus fuscus TaxID=238119 RepID=UPI003F4E63A1